MGLPVKDLIVFANLFSVYPHFSLWIFLFSSWSVFLPPPPLCLLWLCFCIAFFLCLLVCLLPVSVSLLLSLSFCLSVSLHFIFFFHSLLSCSSLSPPFLPCVSHSGSVSLPLSSCLFLWLCPLPVSLSPQPLGPCRCDPGFLGHACDLHLWENQGAGWWHNVSAGDPAFSARVGAAGAFLSPPGLLAVFGGEQMGCASGVWRPGSLWPGLKTTHLPQARTSTVPWVTSCYITSLPTPGSAGT